jgi:hypothetical protein
MLLFPDSARVTGAFWWLAGTDLAPTQTRISESLKAASAVMGFASDHPRGFLAVEDLEMVTVPNLLAGVDVDPDCHQMILAMQ